MRFLGLALSVQEQKWVFFLAGKMKLLMYGTHKHGEGFTLDSKYRVAARVDSYLYCFSLTSEDPLKPQMFIKCMFK